MGRRGAGRLLAGRGAVGGPARGMQRRAARRREGQADISWQIAHTDLMRCAIVGGLLIAAVTRCSNLNCLSGGSALLNLIWFQVTVLIIKIPSGSFKSTFFEADIVILIYFQCRLINLPVILHLPTRNPSMDAMEHAGTRSVGLKNDARLAALLSRRWLCPRQTFLWRGIAASSPWISPYSMCVMWISPSGCRSALRVSKSSK